LRHGLPGGQQRGIAQGGVDTGLVGDHAELALAQQRHGGHRDAAGLDHRQPAGGQHGVVGSAQQHAAAGGQLPLFGNHVRDAIDPIAQLLIGPADAGPAQRKALAASRAHMGIEQGVGGVEPIGVAQAVRRREQVGPLGQGRQAFAAKGVLVAAGAQRDHGRAAQALGAPDFAPAACHSGATRRRLPSCDIRTPGSSSASRSQSWQVTCLCFWSSPSQ
jgi:hypothetical protein